ncbi:MAG: thioredoxin [Alphaproteobacteria bacterium]|nr:thioredoxin [Alphaproteobacteria bacterium]
MEFIIGQQPKTQAAKAAGPASPGPDTAGDVIKDSNTQAFMRDVIEASQKVPVIVDFWAPWCGPCKQLGPSLEKLVRQAGGLVRLVKINVDENQELAQQMRISSIPMVYAFHRGQPVDGFAGAVPESQLRAFIERLTGGAKAPIDQALEQAHAALKVGDAEGAAALFGRILSEDPANVSAIGGMIRAAVALGEIAQAKQIAQSLTEALKRQADIAAALSALELAEQSAGATGDVTRLKAAVAASPADHQARYDLALALFAQSDAEAAIAELLAVIKRARSWNDDAARKQLVKIFDALGPSDPLTLSGRRQLSSILFS